MRHMDERSRVLAIVTVNWNGADNTLRCLRALRSSAAPRWHLYIVDNASTDGSADRLDGLGDDVTMLRSDKNGGWTGGNNAGIRVALDAGHDRILILNNDAFVRSDTIGRLLEHARARDDLPVLGPVHRGVGQHSYDFDKAHRDPKTQIPHWASSTESDSDDSHLLVDTAYISGAAMLVHRDHVEQVGLLDERFFLNFDDTDWCARAAAAGFPLLMARDAAIDHVGSASIGGRRSPLQAYFLARNRLLYAEKHTRMLSRLRLARRYLWEARSMARGSALRLIAQPADLVAAAFRRGVLDYALRRFGDCPAIVREWQASYRGDGCKRAEAA